MARNAPRKRRKQKPSQALLLISPAPPSVAVGSSADRLGGVEHGRIRDATAALLARAVHIENIEPAAFANRLSGAVEQTAQAIRLKVASTIGDFRVEEIKLSFAVSAEGHIGVATAGMEASIEVTLKHHPVATIK